jgi:hypothetical protein
MANPRPMYTRRKRPVARMQSDDRSHTVYHQPPPQTTLTVDRGKMIMCSPGQYDWSVVFRWRSLFAGGQRAISGQYSRGLLAHTLQGTRLGTKEYEVIPYVVRLVCYLLVAIRPLLRMTDVLPIAAPTAGASTKLAAVARRMLGHLTYCDVRASA